MLILPRFIKEKDLVNIPLLPDPNIALKNKIEDGLYYCNTLAVLHPMTQEDHVLDLSLDAQKEIAKDATEWLCSLVAVSEGVCSMVKIFVIKAYSMEEILAEV